MKRSLQNVGLLLYLLLVVKITKSEDNVLYRLVRAVHGRTQNASLYNTDPSWYNNKQQPNATRSQWTNPGGQYTQGYNPNYPPPGGNNPGGQYTQGYNSNYPPPGGNNSGGQYNQGYNQNYPPPGGNNPGGRYAQGYLVNQNYPQPGGRTQNQYGQNADPYGYYSKQPSWNGTASQSNNPGGNYQGNNQGNVGWNLPAGSSSYPSGNQQYRPSSYSSTSPPWDNHGNSHNYPSHAGGRPQNTTWNSPNFNGYNSNPLGTWNSTNPQRNYQYAGPNDLMIHSYRRKRAANNYYYSSRPSYSRNNYREFRNCSSSKYYQGNYTCVNTLNNTSGYNNTFPHRYIRSISNNSRHHLSWRNIDPAWYNSTPPAYNGSYWNRPGGHYYQWNLTHHQYNNESYWDYDNFHREHERHHHRHHKLPLPPPQYEPPPPQYGPPPPQGPPQHGPPQHGPPQHGPPQHGPPPQFGPGGPPRFAPPPPGPNPPSSFNNTVPGAENGTSSKVPEIDIGSDVPVTNGTSNGGPEFEGGSVNGTNSWGPEIPDLNNFDSTPVPQ